MEATFCLGNLEVQNGPLHLVTKEQIIPEDLTFETYLTRCSDVKQLCDTLHKTCPKTLDIPLDFFTATLNTFPKSGTFLGCLTPY